MMQTTVILCMVIAVGSQGKVFERNPPASSSRIIGGVYAKQGEYPSQASLQNSEKHVCSANIISEQWALTAGHCVYGLPVSDHSILAGTINLQNGGTRHQVSNIIVHEQYNKSDSWRNDIALLQVNPPFNLDGINVQAIALPDKGHNPSVGSRATVVGWGADYMSGPISDELRAVDLQISDQQICSSAYEVLYQHIKDGQICADVPEGGKGSCNGDTGSPLIVDDVLEGLVSFTLFCATKGFPTVYTRVSYYRDWINQHAGV
ncbi:mite allergen Der p 3-like [Periplaneta americana]|uniref:mite allergen Der p 3-like n=1 Tax=Periplaneta americana TaxID=6978 RepID=UPI0037E93289